jgi:hypothetical protein
VQSRGWALYHSQKLFVPRSVSERSERRDIGIDNTIQLALSVFQDVEFRITSHNRIIIIVPTAAGSPLQNPTSCSRHHAPTATEQPRRALVQRNLIRRSAPLSSASTSAPCSSNRRAISKFPRTMPYAMTSAGPCHVPLDQRRGSTVTVQCRHVRKWMPNVTGCARVVPSVGISIVLEKRPNYFKMSVIAARWSEVQSSSLSLAFTSAPCSSSHRTTSRCPRTDANSRGVRPHRPGAFTSAPCLSSDCTTLR